MGAPGLAVRLDWEAGQLRQLARRERDGRVTARLLAIANGLDGFVKLRNVAARSCAFANLKRTHRPRCAMPRTPPLERAGECERW
jgi:hypothetical protein